MKNLKVHFSSATDDWATPQKLFDELNFKYGPLELDVACSLDNIKCPYGFTNRGPDDDGLTADWVSFKYKCWMNPPYGREIGKWVKKAYEESLKGCLVVSLLPARTDTRWFHEYIYRNRSASIEFIRGRLKFGKATNSAPFPSMIVVFGVENESTE